MKMVFLCLSLALAGAGCFRESRQSHLTVTAPPSVNLRYADEQSVAAALARVAAHHDLTLGLPEAAQREFFEALENKTELSDATPFVAGSDGAHFWLVATSEAQHNVLTLGTENQGGTHALKTMTSRPTYNQFFTSRLLAEAGTAIGRQQFDTGRLLVRNARAFGAGDKADALLAAIDQRQAELLLKAGENACEKKDYRSARIFAEQAAALLPEAQRGPATALVQRALEEEGGELRHFTGHSAAVTSVAVSADGKFALSGSEDKTARVWNLATGKEVRAFAGHHAAVRGVAFAPDGLRAVSAGDDGFVEVWDTGTGQPTLEIDEHGWKLTCVDFSRDGRSLLAGSEDYHVKIWDASTGKRLQSFSGHGWKVTAVAFSPSGDRAISASDDDSVRLWDVNTGAELRAQHNGLAHVKTVAWSPEGRYVLSAGDDKLLKLWNLDNGHEERAFKGHTQSVTGVAVSPDGRFAASVSPDGTLRLWRMETGAEVRALNAPAASCISFCPDGKTVLTGAADGTLTLWQLPREVWPAVQEVKQ
jgi:WD40 repeat protein